MSGVSSFKNTELSMAEKSFKDYSYTDEEIDRFEQMTSFNLDIIYKLCYDSVSKGAKNNGTKLYAYLRRRYLKENHLID